MSNTPPLGAPGSNTAGLPTAVFPRWSISYTVKNSGIAPASSTKIGFAGSGPLVERNVPELPVGATTTGQLFVSRSACFLALTAVADSGLAVTEGNETNNVKRVMGVSPPCPPRYRIEAVSFKALDESGLDAGGSDEPYWIFNSVGGAGTASSKASGVFEDVDSGETRFFGPEGCIWGCTAVGDPAPVGVGLNVQLWEQDNGNVSDTLSGVAKMFADAGDVAKDFGNPAWIGTVSAAVAKALEFFAGLARDDLLGNNTYGYSAADLASRLPTTGGSFTNDRLYARSNADYRLITRITRTV